MTNTKRYPAEAWDTLQCFFRVGKINNHILHFMASLSGKLDLTRMNRAVSMAMDAFPLTRCKYSENFSHSYWQVSNFASDDRIQLIETDQPDLYINRFLYREWKETDCAQLEIGIIRSEKSDTLCVAINHMLCDAAGFKEFLYMLSSFYNNVSAEQNILADPLTTMKDRSIHQVLKALSTEDRRQFHSSKYRMPKQHISFQFDGDVNNPFIERRVLPQESFRRIISYAKLHGATVNDMMLTAFHRVIYHQFGQTTPLACANDLRKYLPAHKAGGICNLVTNLYCDVNLEANDSFEDVLLKVKTVMMREKANIGCMKSLIRLETFFHVAPYKLVKALLQENYSNPLIAFTNIGILDSNQLKFGPLEVTDAFMTGSIKYAPYFQLALSTIHDEATLSVNLYGTKSDREKIAEFLDQFVLELQNAVPANESV